MSKKTETKMTDAALMEYLNALRYAARSTDLGCELEKFSEARNAVIKLMDDRDRLSAEVLRLQAERDAMAKDAERYKWLRDFARIPAGEHARLIEVEKARFEELNASIAHGQHMIGGILELALTPGVMDAIGEHNRIKERTK